MRSLCFLAITGLACASQAAMFQFAATIDGIQSGSGSPANGILLGSYDDVANSFDFSWNITNELIGMPASPGSHLHNAPAGSNGPIVFAFNEPDGTWALAGSATWTGLSTTMVDELFAGNLYANFHTTSFPGGEVRGQVLLVPAPASLALLGVGGLACVRRRH